MSANRELLERFYSAFRDRDAEAMASCYHAEAQFSDPVFTNLHGDEVGAMWRMLVSRGKDTRISFSDIEANDTAGSCRWEARYTYGPSRRKVHNVVRSNFEFKDGKILRQCDEFNLWRWSAMALGLSGLILGWSPIVRNKIRAVAAKALREFCSR